MKKQKKKKRKRILYALDEITTHQIKYRKRVTIRDLLCRCTLMTQIFEPKLSDFGIAKMLGKKESKLVTEVIGTISYMDPEYISNAKLTCILLN